MDFPAGFPGHLEPSVDAAIHQAEEEFRAARKQIRHWSKSAAEPLISKYVKTIFFTFARQVCHAVEERTWNHEKARRELELYRHNLIFYARSRKHPDADMPVGSGRNAFEDQVVNEIEDSEDWGQIQTEFKRVAEVLAQPSQTSSHSSSGQRRGYRQEIKDWMKDAGIHSQQQAARTLGISIDVLKSIMSDKGRARYSSDTLKNILV